MKNLRKLIEKDPYLKGADKVLLASSGGIDSMCLAHLLKIAEIPFDIAHMNYQLRAEDSDNDQHFLFEWCWNNNISFHTKTVSTERLKGNTQEIAREFRYDWLEILSSKYGYQLVLTAHHANDLVEGAFLKLWRGVEWEDRFLMPEKRNYVYRPLSGVFRNEIEEWVKENSVEFVEDESNKSSEKYDRNYFRLEILRSFEDRRPGSLKLFHEKLCREEKQRKLYHCMIRDLAERLFEKNTRGWILDLTKLHELDLPDHSTLLNALLKERGFPMLIADQILSAETGASWSTPAGKIWLDRKKLIFDKITETDHPNTFLTISQPGTYKMVDQQYWKIELHDYVPHDRLGKSQLFLDKTNFPFPWNVRNWAFGDTMAPLGMGGKHKKLKDIFIDQKIPRPDKRLIMFLEIRNEIIWIPGIKKSEKLKELTTGAEGWLITVE